MLTQTAKCKYIHTHTNTLRAYRINKYAFSPHYRITLIESQTWWQCDDCWYQRMILLFLYLPTFYSSRLESSSWWKIIWKRLHLFYVHIIFLMAVLLARFTRKRLSTRNKTAAFLPLSFIRSDWMIQMMNTKATRTKKLIIDDTKGEYASAAECLA